MYVNHKQLKRKHPKNPNPKPEAKKDHIVTEKLPVLKEILIHTRQQKVSERFLQN